MLLDLCFAVLAWSRPSQAHSIWHVHAVNIRQISCYLACFAEGARCTHAKVPMLMLIISQHAHQTRARRRISDMQLWSRRSVSDNASQGSNSSRGDCMPWPRPYDSRRKQVSFGSSRCSGRGSRPSPLQPRYLPEPAYFAVCSPGCWSMC